MIFPYKYYTYIILCSSFVFSSCTVNVEYGVDQIQKPLFVKHSIAELTPFSAPKVIINPSVDISPSPQSFSNNNGKLLMKKNMSYLEKVFQNNALVDIHEYDPTILVDLRYASENNFLGQDLYNGLKTAYLLPDVAQKLMNAQTLIKKNGNEYSLVVLDATRPHGVQKKMWEMVRGTEKERYLADPHHGSLHNFGVAVDVSFCIHGEEVDMGTPFDFFGEEAEPRFHQKMLISGRLTEEQVKNRDLLKEVMESAGFFAIKTEWWHFNAYPKNYARENYRMIN